MSRFWTPDPHSRGGSFNCKLILQRISLMLCVFALASCGFSDDSAKKKSSEMTPASSQMSSALPPLTSPPGLNDRPSAPGSLNMPKTPDGLPALQPPRGVNTINLFDEDIRDKDERLDRLEYAVQDLRNDFDAMAPAITRLVAVESDIQDLITQLETLTLQPASRPAPAPFVQPALPDPPSAAPTPLQPAKTMEPIMDEKPKAAPPPKKQSVARADNTVFDIRIGEHPDKTRIVLDLKGDANFSYDLDNGEKILVVEMPNLKWNAATRKTYKNVKLLSAHQTDSMNNGQGTRLILQLKSPASVVYTGTLNGSGAGIRKIVIDIAAGSAAATQ